MAFGFAPESCSASSRNPVRLQVGMLFAFSPESCSDCPGIRSRQLVVLPEERTVTESLVGLDKLEDGSFCLRRISCDDYHVDGNSRPWRVRRVRPRAEDLPCRVRRTPRRTYHS